MDTLPEEMLQEIMEYLRYSDLKCFRLVCKKFYEASLAFRLVNRDNFAYGCRMISPSHNYKFDNFMKILSTTERKFYHFYFFATEITVGFRDFVEKRAKYILSLKFEHCEIMYPMNFCESINECIKLKSLELQNMSWRPVDGMDSSRIPDDVLNVLMDTNVKNLQLDVDVGHLHHVIYVSGRFEDLKCVYLIGIYTDEELMIIADNLNLTTIHINCLKLTDRGFKYLVENQRRLQRVGMFNCSSITDESFFAIAEYLKDLKELKIYRTSMTYSFVAINRIINFTSLRRLDCRVAHYSGLAATTVGGDVTVSKCLRQLSMLCMDNEMYGTYIAKNFISLTELELIVSNGVTNETLRLIGRNLKNLKKLSLVYCNAINAFENDVSQLTFSENFNDLEELNLSGSEWLSDSTLETCFKLSSLRILNVGRCKQLTVKSFVAMPKNFPCLEDLNMAGLTVDKDVLLSTVSLMKRLCKLDISLSGPITEHVLKSLYDHSDPLHRINFDRYPEITWFIRSWERKTFVDAEL